MKIISTVLTVLLVLLIPRTLWAGGAAAARRRPPKQVLIKQQQQKMQKEIMIQQKQQQQAQQQAQQQESQIKRQELLESIDDSEIHEVTIAQLWDALKETSRSWVQILDQEAKVATVTHFIYYYRQNGIRINKHPALYANMIDAMSYESPEILDQPFQNILRIVAIIEYDFNNGQDKDMMARQILGDREFIDNKRRLGLLQDHNH